MTLRELEIDTKSLKKEVIEELARREILMSLEEDEIDLFELFRVLLKNWKLVIFLPLSAMLLTAVYSLSIPDQYRSTGTVFVHSKGNSIASNLSMFTSISGFGNMGLQGLNSIGDYLPALLNSNAMKKRVINHFGLATSTLIFGDPLPSNQRFDEVLKKVEEIISINKNKDGLISISAETASAAFSASLVNSYLKYLGEMVKGPTREKRAFIENQLKRTVAELEKAELALKSFQESNNLIAFDAQAAKIVEQLASLESKQIESDISLKMNLSILKEAEEFPELENKLEARRIAEQSRISTIGQMISETEGNLARFPALSLTYARLKRDLLIKEKVFATLTEQLEIARVSESEEGSTFEVIDEPFAAGIHSKPRRSIMVILAGISTLVVAIFTAFLLEFINKRQNKFDAKPFLTHQNS